MVNPSFIHQTLCFFLYLLLTFNPTALFGMPNDAHFNKEKTCAALKTLPIQDIVPMRDFLKTNNRTANFENAVFLVTFKNIEKKGKTEEIKGVFKPVPADDTGDAHAEVAAYKASVLLGFPEVPPTVLRTINGQLGSLQLYVEPAIHINEEQYADVLQMATKEDVANLKLFYFVFGQWDSGGHNIIVSKDLITQKIQLNAIDNSGIRNRQYVQYGKPPFVRLAYSDTLKTNDWHRPFSFEDVNIINTINTTDLQNIFGHHFPASIYQRLLKMKKPIHYVLYKNSLWIQHHKEDSSFVISHTNYYPSTTIEALKKLNKKALKAIFAEAKRVDFLTEDYLDAILERRDQIMDRVCSK